MPGPYEPIREAADPAYRAMVVQAQALRGAIVSSYAHIEFLLADVCMKAWRLAEYKHLRAPFPFKVETRIKAAEALFKSPGRLNQYYPDVDGLFPRLLNYEQMRHFMAHGLMIVTPAATSPRVEIQLWRPARKGGADIGFINTDFDQMDFTASELSLYTDTLIRVFHRVYIEQGLEGGGN